MQVKKYIILLLFKNKNFHLLNLIKIKIVPNKLLKCSLFLTLNKVEIIYQIKRQIIITLKILEFALMPF